DRKSTRLNSSHVKISYAVFCLKKKWPEFSSIHPFAPEADVVGYLDLIEQLQTWLAEVTGYDAVSLQPNAGSQANSPDFSRSAATTTRTVTTSATCASSRRARTAPIPPAPCSPF